LGQEVIPIWPGAAPGSESWTQKEETLQDTIRRVRNVTRPTLTVYIPPAASANGTAVVVCPGGGYRFLAIDYEGHDVARWLNTLGVTAFVLKYRLVQTGDPGEKDAAIMAARRKTVMPMVLADGQQAIRLVRARSAEWHIAPNRIGIMGFSAGGYVTAAVALQHDPASRPDFAAPIYGAMPDDFSVPKDAAPLFLAHADDDKTVPPVKTSVRLYTAWKEAQVPAELHIYLHGGHGFGMRKKGLPVDTWIDRFREWLDNQGLLKPVQ
jgi:acetyl esterase/lipase